MIVLDDTEVRLGVYSKQCSFCRHFIKGYECAAFDTIPDKIWLAEFDHKKAYPGDHGVRFEPQGIKHRPGGVDHDQSTHGNWAHGPATNSFERSLGIKPNPDRKPFKDVDDRRYLRRKWDRNAIPTSQDLDRIDEIFQEATRGKTGMHVADFIASAYEFKDEETGFYTRVDGIQGRAFVGIVGTVFDKDGNDIGHFGRSIDPEEHVIIHDTFTMSAETRGKGFGSRFYQHCEETYKDAGIDGVMLGANLSVGGYAWARMGFDFADEADRKRIQADLRSRIAWHRKYPSPWSTPDYDPVENNKRMNELDHFIKRNLSHPWQIAAYAESDGYRIGKAVLLGNSWSAIKWLDETRPGYSVGRVYYDLKKKALANG